MMSLCRAGCVAAMIRSTGTLWVTTPVAQPIFAAVGVRMLPSSVAVPWPAKYTTARSAAAARRASSSSAFRKRGLPDHQRHAVGRLGGGRLGRGRRHREEQRGHRRESEEPHERA
jgi:hypothetical protein